MIIKRSGQVACVSCGDTEQWLSDIGQWECCGCTRVIMDATRDDLLSLARVGARGTAAWRELAGAVMQLGDVERFDLDGMGYTAMRQVEAQRERLAAEEKSARAWHRRWAVLYESLAEVYGATVETIGPDDHDAGERGTVEASKAIDSVEESHRDDVRDRHGREMERAALVALLSDPNDPEAAQGGLVYLAARLRARAEHETGVASVLRAMLAAPSR